MLPTFCADCCADPARIAAQTPLSDLKFTALPQIAVRQVSYLTSGDGYCQAFSFAQLKALRMRSLPPAVDLAFTRAKCTPCQSGRRINKAAAIRRMLSASKRIIQFCARVSLRESGGTHATGRNLGAQADINPVHMQAFPSCCRRLSKLRRSLQWLPASTSVLRRVFALHYLSRSVVKAAAENAACTQTADNSLLLLQCNTRCSASLATHMIRAQALTDVCCVISTGAH